ncbi:hypothetical protein BH09PSE3_BH09PSE3_08130 [soil metagenome]
MVLLLTAMTSFGFMVFGIGLIAHILRHSGAAVLAALAGEARFPVVQTAPRIRRAARFRTQKMMPSPQMRAAA